MVSVIVSFLVLALLLYIRYTRFYSKTRLNVTLDRSNAMRRVGTRKDNGERRYDEMELEKEIDRLRSLPHAPKALDAAVFAIGAVALCSLILWAVGIRIV